MRPVSEENVELIERSFREWDDTGEPPWHLLHADVEVHDHDIPDADVYHGREGAERWLAHWELAWSEFSFAPEEFLDAGDRVVAFVHVKATGRGSSVAVERDDAILYSVSDGKILRMDYYNDRDQALRAAGL
jgi:ketosteroid isomerase-like protein